MKLYLDMDGVLADFMVGVCGWLGVRNPYQPAAIAGALGNWDTPELLGMEEEEFFEPCLKFDFWANLPRTREAGDIMELTADFGPTILSTPSGDFVSCKGGKERWLDKHFGEYDIDLITTTNKAMYAKCNVLIDDNERNCKEWMANGGRAFLVPRPWNYRHRHEYKLDVLLRRQLDEWGLR